MNFCCHDDYTLSDSFTLDDVSIYIGYQNWINTSASDPDEDIYDTNKSDLENFKTWFADQVSQGNLNAIEQEISVLPKFDCGDFTESVSFTLDDVAIYIGHQNWINTSASKPDEGTYDSGKNEVENFRDWYTEQASLGNLNAIEQEIKHLPSLETDSVVHTIDGDVAKGGDGLTTEIDTTEGSVGDLLVSLDCNSAVHLGTYTGEQIKAVELVFDNVQFTPESDSVTGMSITDGDKEVLVNAQFKDTLDNATLNYYYDYSIRTDGTEPRKNRSVIGFIDTTENGNGEKKTTLGQLQFRVKADRYSIITEIATEPKIADVRIYDDTAEVERYELVSCGSDTETE
jgi:hypothetical protein